MMTEEERLGTIARARRLRAEIALLEHPTYALRLADAELGRMIAELEQRNRDHWSCPKCGSGVCVPAGSEPTELEHVLFDGRVCGVFEYEGKCNEPRN